MFVHTMTRPVHEVNAVTALKRAGATDRQPGHLTGVPVETIRTWRQRGIPLRTHSRRGDACAHCGDGKHSLPRGNDPAYAYLLGVYLGDGWLSAAGSSWCLNVALDTAYPGIIESCRRAIATVNGGRLPWCARSPD